MLMMRRNPILIIGLAALLLIGGYYAFSRYLVSKLDGAGSINSPQAGGTQNLLQYSSENGVSFMYPDTYELSSRTEGGAEDRWDVLVLLPKGYVPPQGSEGPPAIVMSVFEHEAGTPLETWVKNDPRSNYQLSPDGRLDAVRVGGQPAVAYRHSGLYETDAVAVAHQGTMFVFSAGWIGADDPIRADFQNLLSTVHFSL